MFEHTYMYTHIYMSLPPTNTNKQNTFQFLNSKNVRGVIQNDGRECTKIIGTKGRNEKEISRTGLMVSIEYLRKQRREEYM